MKTLEFIKYSLMSLLVAFSLSACVDHIPEEEELPSTDIDFEYKIINDTVYELDYYVGGEIEFKNTSFKKGTATWNFGDGSDLVIGEDITTHKYSVAGNYIVELTIEGAGTVKKPIYISDIKPILKLKEIEGGLCEVKTTFVEVDVELPNPEGLDVEYSWTFPKGTLNEKGAIIENSTAANPGKIKFSNVGSQTVKLNVKLGGRSLEEGKINVQVAFNKEVPTLYYAVKSGNIMALKLGEQTEDLRIEPFDMGVKSGQHPMNILFCDSLLYIIDPGLQFTYVDDSDRNLGDGRIMIMSKDGGRVESMITNVGGYAIDDPFYGYREGDFLYVANRNTGFYKISLKDRNQAFSNQAYPWYVSNERLGYYGVGLSYGGMNACFGKVKDTWYWCKTFNGNGIFRFTDADIDKKDLPAAGQILSGTMPKSFVYDQKNDRFFFSIVGGDKSGVYCCPLAALDNLKKKTDYDAYKLKTAAGESLSPIAEAGKGEGGSGEFIGICQMALDEATGAVYFGFRSGDANIPSGLYKYNPESGKLEVVVKGVEIYGVAINKENSKLF